MLARARHARWPPGRRSGSSDRGPTSKGISSLDRDLAGRLLHQAPRTRAAGRRDRVAQRLDERLRAPVADVVQAEQRTARARTSPSGSAASSIEQVLAGLGPELAQELEGANAVLRRALRSGSRATCGSARSQSPRLRARISPIRRWVKLDMGESILMASSQEPSRLGSARRQAASSSRGRAPPACPGRRS